MSISEVRIFQGAFLLYWYVAQRQSNELLIRRLKVRILPYQIFARLAQWLEQVFYTDTVEGSSPSLSIQEVAHSVEHLFVAQSKQVRFLSS